MREGCTAVQKRGSGSGDFGRGSYSLGFLRVRAGPVVKGSHAVVHTERWGILLTSRTWGPTSSEPASPGASPLTRAWGPPHGSHLRTTPAWTAIRDLSLGEGRTTVPEGSSHFPLHHIQAGGRHEQMPHYPLCLGARPTPPSMTYGQVEAGCVKERHPCSMLVDLNRVRDIPPDGAPHKCERVMSPWDVP